MWASKAVLYWRLSRAPRLLGQALRDEFQRFDLPANAAKKRSRVAGLFAIGAGAVSLALAAATPVYRGSPHIWVFGLIAAFLGIIGPTPRALNKKGDHHMFSLTSINITQMQGRDPSARLGRRAAPSVKIIGAAAIALLASANTFASAAENPSQVIQEHHACAVTLGLDPSGRRYRTCIRSLDRSVSEWDQVLLAESARSACARKGLQLGTPAFAVCVVDSEQSSVNAGSSGGQSPQPVEGSTTEPHSASDTRSANTTWAREGLACADLGIAPGSGAFSQCVSDLHNSLWAEQNLEQN